MSTHLNTLKCLGRFVLIGIIYFCQTSNSFGMKTLKCKTYSPRDDYTYVTAAALAIGEVDLYANCKDFRGDRYNIVLFGLSLGGGISINNDGFEGPLHEHFLIHCPFVRKSRFKSQVSYGYTGIQFGAIAGGRLGVASNIYGGICTVSGYGTGLLGGMVQFAGLTITPEVTPSTKTE